MSESRHRCVIIHRHTYHIHSTRTWYFLTQIGKPETVYFRLALALDDRESCSKNVSFEFL